MTDTTREQAKRMIRVHRIRGQVDAIEHALQAGDSAERVRQQIASCRGALGGLLALVAESHIRTCLGDSREGLEASKPILDMIHGYFK